MGSIASRESGRFGTALSVGLLAGAEKSMTEEEVACSNGIICSVLLLMEDGETVMESEAACCNGVTSSVGLMAGDGESVPAGEAAENVKVIAGGQFVEKRKSVGKLGTEAAPDTQEASNFGRFQP